MNKSVLGIMFRIPQYGKVKKRLAAQIGTEDALSVYAAMLYETVKNVSQLKSVDLYGFYEGAISKTESVLESIQTMPQQGKDLGERMLNAVQWLFEKGYNKVVLIGADSPDLPVEYIKDAFLKLNSCELAIGPAEDGGYYLIGMNRPLDIIFKDIKWDSNSVLKDTISIANNEGIRYFLLPHWYDIDDIESLRQWKNQQFSNSFLP